MGVSWRFRNWKKSFPEPGSSGRKANKSIGRETRKRLNPPPGISCSCICAKPRSLPEEKPEAVEVGAEADLSGHGITTPCGRNRSCSCCGRIVDFKTSARKSDVELLAHTAETQTTSYGLLYREATGAKENGIEIHHLIKTKQPKIVVHYEINSRGWWFTYKVEKAGKAD